jgi:hypothetical protein
MNARVPPITKALPVTKIDIKRRKVPKNSATKGTAFISTFYSEIHFTQ